MKRYQTQRTLAILMLVLLILTLIGVATNTVATLKLASGVKDVPTHSLPCAAVPTRLILEDPICAQKLLESMNVTNVRVRPGVSLAPQAGNDAAARPEAVPVAGGAP